MAAQNYTVTLVGTITTTNSDLPDAKGVAAQVAALVSRMSASLVINGATAAVTGGGPAYTLTLTVPITSLPGVDTVGASGTTAQIAAYVAGMVMNPPISAVSATFA